MMSTDGPTTLPRFAEPKRLTSGPYLARNPLVLAAMAGMDALGLVLPARSGSARQASELLQSAPRPVRVLVANAGHLGDLVVMLPLLAALRRHPRVAEIGVLVGPWGASVFEGAGGVDRVHLASHWTLDRGPGELRDKLRRHAQSRLSAVRALRRARYDVALDAYAWLGNASDLLWAAGIPVRVGFPSGGGGTLYTERVAFDPHASVADNGARLFRRLLGEALSGTPRACYPGFRPDPVAASRVAALTPYVVVHVGAGHAPRAWPGASWRALCMHLRDRGFTLVFTGAPAEVAYVRSIAEPVAGVVLAGQLDFRGFASVIRQADGLVCVDTVAGHLAACFEVPSAVLINGVQPSARWHPNQRYARVVTTPVGCAPCSRSAGCAALACLLQTEPDRVFAALCEAMEEKRRGLLELEDVAGVERPAHVVAEREGVSAQPAAAVDPGLGREHAE